MASGRSPRQGDPERRRDPERRARILRAAADLASRRGFTTVSLADIGAEAGIVGSGIYRHFGSKASILVALLDQVMGRLMTRAAQIIAAPRSFLARTSISAAIDFSMDQFNAAPVAADRRVIDISGDGTSNAGRPITEARDEAVAKGVTINGLAIINTQASPGFTTHTQPPGGLPNYFRENVIGGAGAFLLVVENFETFADAMTRKLVNEIAGVPGNPRAAALKPF